MDKVSTALSKNNRKRTFILKSELTLGSKSTLPSKVNSNSNVPKSRPKVSPKAYKPGPFGEKSKVFPIVGIGASPGGLEAVSLFLKCLPPDLGVSVVVIQHLDPQHESFTADILARLTDMPVLQAQHRMCLEPDHVYVIPPNCYLSVSSGALRLSPRKSKIGLHLPIDFFFSSLAEEFGSQALGIILSGTASDGTRGLLAIKSEGGVTFAQDPTSAKYGGMPQSAIAAGAVDFVDTPENIANEIARIARSPYVSNNDINTLLAEGEHDKEESNEATLNKIFTLLRNRAQVDFTHYKRSTIMRRLARRMLVNKSRSLSNYATYLEQNPDEAKALFAEILIHVTEFFRDGETFESLKLSALPKLMKGHDPNSPLRVWVPGCSTGEEVYTLAIVLMEYLENQTPRISLQIFASDISENAIKKARSGIYGEVVQGISKSRLEKYFDKVTGGHRIKKVIRDLCVFSIHDVIRDPPFAKVDLISCRNLLIYFNEELQRRVLPVFHYALNPGGLLLLGKAENICRAGDGGIDGAVLSLIDIHRQKTALEATRAAERNLELVRADALKIIESNPIPFLVVKADRTIWSANEAFFQKFYPLASGQLPNLPTWNECPLNTPELNQVLEKTLNEGLDFCDLEIKCIFPTVGPKDLILNARQVELPGSGVKTALIAIEDVTSRKQGELDQARALNLLEEISRRIPGLVFQLVLRPDGGSYFPFVSEGIRRIFGLTPEDVCDDSSKFISLIHPEDRIGFVTAIKQSGETLDVLSIEFRLKHPDGKQLWVLCHGVAERFDKGVLWNGYISDITDRKAAEQLLKRSEEKYRNLASSSYDGVMVVRRDGSIEFANKRLEELFGYGPGELLNQKYNELIPEKLRETHTKYHGIDKFISIAI